jgi:hypothetical protein
MTAHVKEQPFIAIWTPRQAPLIQEGFKQALLCRRRYDRFLNASIVTGELQMNSIGKGLVDGLGLNGYCRPHPRSETFSRRNENARAGSGRRPGFETSSSLDAHSAIWDGRLASARAISCPLLSTRALLTVD